MKHCHFIQAHIQVHDPEQKKTQYGCSVAAPVPPPLVWHVNNVSSPALPSQLAPEKAVINRGARAPDNSSITTEGDADQKKQFTGSLD